MDDQKNQKEHDEVERLRVQLAACGVAAMTNTHESREQQKCIRGDYGWSASYQDVINAVGREIIYREALETLAKFGNQIAIDALRKEAE